ncbi:MAG: hypothetical protein RLY11_399 [Bacteroidota bacterium]|jgi:5-oxoprolinase (ATP-hydrolysing) subunit A
MTIDLNCDMGEGMLTDAQIMPFISSANIACGGHAGDANTMQKTIQLALQHQVAIGAHPSYPDRENFGRKEINLPLDTIIEQVQMQIYTIKELAEREGAVLHHIKPHGALYNTAARDTQVAQAIVQAIKSVAPFCKVVGLPGSVFEEVCISEGLTFFAEGFADRTYTEEGKLTPRSEPNAMIHSPEAAVEQVIQMIERKQVKSTQGNWLNMPVKTICIHGDGANAVDFAKAIHSALKDKNISTHH